MTLAHEDLFSLLSANGIKKKSKVVVLILVIQPVRSVLSVFDLPSLVIPTSPTALEDIAQVLNLNDTLADVQWQIMEIKRDDSTGSSSQELVGLNWITSTIEESQTSSLRQSLLSHDASAVQIKVRTS